MHKISEEAMAGIILLVLILVISTGAGGYYYGQKKSAQAAYSSGYNTGHGVGYGKGIKDSTAELNDLNTKYNTLVDDYNDLRTKALQYISATSNSRSYVTCNSSSYGINDRYSTSTCY